LTQNKLAAIQVPNFLSDARCDVLLQQIKAIGLETYLDGELLKLGPSQYEYATHKAAYFESVEAQTYTKLPIFLWFVEKLKNEFSRSNLKLSVAYEQEFAASYCPAVLRGINNGLLVHNDFAYREAVGWAIQNIEWQFAFNLHLTTCVNGTTTAFNRTWQPSDETVFKLQTGTDIDYSYQPEIVAKSEQLTVQAFKGELTMFSSVNYHLVSKGIGDRYTIGGFIGKLKNKDEFVMWG
jgi:hypothetical protein